MAAEAQEGPEIYQWINELSKHTGLGVDTLSDLYLKGFGVKVEPNIVKDGEGRVVTTHELSFWKRYKDEH